MLEAEHALITGTACPPIFLTAPPAPSRRHLLAAVLGGSAAAGLLAPLMPPASAFGGKVGDKLDERLIADCVSFAKIDDARRAAGRLILTDEDGIASDDAWDEAYAKVHSVRPQTVAGARYRADVAFRAMLGRVTVERELAWDEQADAREWLAMDCLWGLAYGDEGDPDRLGQGFFQNGAA